LKAPVDNWDGEREWRAGFVNPAILANAGMDRGAVFVATCVAAAVSTLVMGLYANYPIALAPGMGLNAFFAFTVVITCQCTWQRSRPASGSASSPTR
jgi:adenine/guanine/hypoxanthine permease